jgi:hypothetical protein
LKSILKRLDELEEMVKQAPTEDAAADDDAEKADDAANEEAPAADAEDSPEESADKEEAPVEEDQPKEDAEEEESDKIAKTDKATTKKADTSSEGASELLSELKKLNDRIAKLESEPAQAQIVVSREIYAKMDDKAKTRIEEINKRLDEILEIKSKKPSDYNTTLMDEALKLVEEKKRLKGDI